MNSINPRIPNFVLVFGTAAIIAITFYPLLVHPRRRSGSHVAFVSTTRQQKLNRIVVLLRRGNASLQENKNADAEEFYRKALAIDGTDPQSLLATADACERQGKWKDALQAWEELLQSPSRSNLASDPVTHMRYALALTQNLRWQEATKEYTSALNEIEQRKSYSLPHKALDPVNIGNRRLEAALNLIIGVYPPSYGQLSLTLAAADRRQHVEKAIRLEPQWADAMRVDPAWAGIRDLYGRDLSG